MSAAALSGTCQLCRGTFDKRAMAKHLDACGKKADDTPAGFLLLIEGLHQPEYWLYVNAPAETTLADLDAFLRKIWVECCGHMSRFTLGDASYVSGIQDSEEGEFEDEEDGFGNEDDGEWNWDYEHELGEAEAFQDDLFGDEFMEGEGYGEDNSMEIALGEVLRPRMRFFYEYDFGTPTELSLKVVAVPKGKPAGGKITLLARNNPPEIPCENCGKPAAKVCSYCLYEGKAWFCSKCSKKHACGEEAFLPVVNSPRVGLCGYEG